MIGKVDAFLFLKQNRMVNFLTISLKETRNSYFCVTPKNNWLMSHENIKNHCHKKSNCVFF